MQNPRTLLESRRLQKLAVIALGIGAIVLLSPANIGWFGLYQAVSSSVFSLTVNLLRVVLIALIIAGLLAPYESLGWWAGWYGSEDATQLSPPPQAQPSPARRFVVYLDGIGMSSAEYSPFVTVFLERLEALLPEDIVLIKGIVPYSTSNVPLTSRRPLSWFWRWVVRVKEQDPTGLVGVLINLRNMFQVSVSVDSRYGYVYNRGTAQVIISSLLQEGYVLGSGTPITLIGFSGGGQVSLGAVSYLRPALSAPIEVISLAGVISGNTGAIQLEHLYHLVGSLDRVAPLGFLIFPERWPLLSGSYWNLANSRGKITYLPLGRVGHDSAKGPLSETSFLPDGRSHLQQTLDIMTGILTREDDAPPFMLKERQTQTPPRKLAQPSSYDLYCQADFNHPEYYPAQQTPTQPYRSVGDWIGRLILPDRQQRYQVRGVLFEVHHAPADRAHWVGRVVPLRWQQTEEVRDYLLKTRANIYFSPQAENSIREGRVHPTRLNYWQQVEPLESIAGARPFDDVEVLLASPVTVEVEEGEEEALSIQREPILIAGRFYGLVTFIAPVPNSDRYQVCHFNRDSGQFDGLEEEIAMPEVQIDATGVRPFTNEGIEGSPLNREGWYIYGAKDCEGIFTVQAIAPRRLWQLRPERTIAGKKAAKQYLHADYWRETGDYKGRIDSVLVTPRKGMTEEDAIAMWKEGDRCLVLHTFGGITGKQKEFAPLGVFFGHFAFGLATVIREPLTGELQFRIAYRQVYTQNPQGTVSAALDWTNYIGDRQFGWLGRRPIVDIVVKLDLLEDYHFGELTWFPLEALAYQLMLMTARYRTGDGTGATFVGPANSCVQDSCQALYRAIQDISQPIAAWIASHPDHPETLRLQRLRELARDIERVLLPWGSARKDWSDDAQSLLGTRLAEQPIPTIAKALTSVSSLLPRLANDKLAEIFLKYGASFWLLRTNQIGGDNPNIEPFAPTKLWL
ncbi:MAG: hypothetical protein AB4290_00310 [Spirulina sp.]